MLVGAHSAADRSHPAPGANRRCRSVAWRRRRHEAAEARGARADSARVVVLMCHEERAAVFALLEQLGARPIDVATELTELLPRLQGRPRS